MFCHCNDIDTHFMTDQWPVARIDSLTVWLIIHIITVHHQMRQHLSHGKRSKKLIDRLFQLPFVRYRLQSGNVLTTEAPMFVYFIPFSSHHFAFPTEMFLTVSWYIIAVHKVRVR